MTAGSAAPPRTRATPRPGSTSPAPGRIALPRLHALDGLRVVAAAVVVWSSIAAAFLGADHPTTVLGMPAALVFFVISGFGRYRPVVAADLTDRRPPRAGRFLFRQAWKLLPVWWVCLAVHAVVFGTAGLHGVRDWFLTVTLLQFVDGSIRDVVVRPGWALSALVVFSLVEPIVAALVVRLRRSVGASMRPATFHLAAASFAALVLFAVPASRLFSAFAVGCAIAVLDVDRRATHRLGPLLRLFRNPPLLVVGTTIGVVVLVALPSQPDAALPWIDADPGLTLLWLAVAIAWTVPVVFGEATAWPTRALEDRRVQRLVPYTLATFLWHDLFVRLVDEHLGGDAHLLAATYLVVGGTAAAAVATRWLVQRPVAALAPSFAPRRGASNAPTIASQEVSNPIAAGGDPTAATGSAARPRRDERARHYPQIDALRVVAALGVVAIHTVVETSGSDTAIRAVTSICLPVFALFLTISGFVLFRPWALATARITDGDGKAPTRPVDGGFGRFWLARILRVYPLYWVVQAVALVQSGTGDIHGVGAWLRIVTLWPFPSDVLHHGLGIIVWTLIVDLFFYAIVPFYGRLLVWLAARGGSFWALNLSVAAVTGVLVVALTYRSIGLYGICILLGVLLAAVDAWQRTARRWIPPIRTLARAWWLAVPGLAVIAAVGFFQNPDATAAEVLSPRYAERFPAMFLMILIGFVPAVFGPASSPYRRFLARRPFVFLGSLTYGIYLWQYVVIRFIERWPDLPVAATVVGIFAATIALAYLSHELVEKPIEAVRRRTRVPRNEPGAVS